MQITRIDQVELLHVGKEESGVKRGRRGSLVSLIFSDALGGVWVGGHVFTRH